MILIEAINSSNTVNEFRCFEILIPISHKIKDDPNILNIPVSLGIQANHAF